MDGRPFTLAGARREGVSEAMIRRGVALGAIRRVVVGVYVDASVDLSLELRAQAVALVIPPGVAVCRNAAAWLHGIDARPIGDVAREPTIEVIVPEGAPTVRRRGIIGVEARELEPYDLLDVCGIPVTTPLRTACDLGRLLGRLEAAAAVDQFLHAGLITELELRGEVERFAGSNGIRQLRFVAATADPLAESPGESWTRIVLIDGGLPRPRAQIKVLDRAGVVIARLDLGYDDVELGVEYMGVPFHTGSVRSAKDQRRRDAIERETSWLVLEAWSGDVLGPRPAVVRAVADAYLARGGRLSSDSLHRLERYGPSYRR